MKFTDIIEQDNEAHKSPYEVPDDCVAVKIADVENKPFTILGFGVYTDKEGVEKAVLGMNVDGQRVRVHTSAKRILGPIKAMTEAAQKGEEVDIEGIYTVKAYHNAKNGKSAYWIEC